MADYENQNSGKKLFQHYRYECIQTNYITNASYTEFLKRISKRNQDLYRKCIKILFYFPGFVNCDNKTLQQGCKSVNFSEGRGILQSQICLTDSISSII